jgi:hypothetical protein
MSTRDFTDVTEAHLGSVSSRFTQATPIRDQSVRAAGMSGSGHGA